MYVCLYTFPFMDHPGTLCAAVYHQAPPCPLLNPGHVEYELCVTNNIKIFLTRAGLEPTTIRLVVENNKHWSTQPITKRCLFKYIEISPPKTESFQIKILIFFIFLLKT